MIDARYLFCLTAAAVLGTNSLSLPALADDPAAAPKSEPVTSTPTPDPASKSTQPAVNVAEVAENARQAVKRDRFTEARPLFKQALNASPDDVALQLEYYAVCQKLNDWSDAVSVLERVFALQPEKEKDLYVDYGVNLFRLRKYDKSKQALKKAVTICKDKGQGYLYLFKIAQLQKDGPSLEDAAEEYLKFKSDDYDVQVGYANHLFAKNKVKEAIEHYKAASKAKPWDSPLHERLAYMLLCQKDYDGSIEEYRKALASRPKNAGAVQQALKYAQAQKTATQGPPPKK